MVHLKPWSTTSLINNFREYSPIDYELEVVGSGGTKLLGGDNNLWTLKHPDGTVFKGAFVTGSKFYSNSLYILI
jgi:hypothetical protein